MDDMVPTDPLHAQAWLRAYQVRPTKKLGQNFLVDRHAADRILAAADLDRTDRVLEIGPGLGALTLRLTECVEWVYAVEYDRRLIPILDRVLHGVHNVQVMEGDILKLDLNELLPSGPFLVVANIPYSITSALVRKLLEGSQKPRRLVLTIQEEVGKRIIAQPGNMSLLALSVQVYGAPRIVARIPASAFFPKPKVESVVLRVELEKQPRIPEEHLPVFFKLAKAGFGQRRKQLLNAVAHGLALERAQVETWLQRASIPPNRRAQELDLEAWAQFAQVVAGDADGMRRLRLRIG